MSTSAKKKTGRKNAPGGGRPRVVLDETAIEGMASIGATNEEIADFLGCHVDTLRDNYSKILVKARANIRLRLRRAQIQSAIGTAGVPPNPTMLIWLGKQLLRQSDKVETPVDEHGEEIPRQRILVGKTWITF